MKRIALQVRMEAALHEKLREAAAWNGVSVSEWCRGVLERNSGIKEARSKEAVVEKSVVTSENKGNHKECFICKIKTEKWCRDREGRVLCQECAVK